jgi:hypothetical protein
MPLNTTASLRMHPGTNIPHEMNHPDRSAESPRIKQLLIRLKRLNQPTGRTRREWCDQTIDLLEKRMIVVLWQPCEQRSPNRTRSSKGPTRASAFEAQGTPQLLRTLMGFTQPRLLKHPYRFAQANNAGVRTEGQIQNGATAVAKASDQ